MGKLVDYECKYVKFYGIDRDILKSLNLDPSDVYRSGEAMAAYADEVRKKTEAAYCKLPFDTFVEGEALGAELIYDGSINGPRKGEDLIKDPHKLLELPLLGPDCGRIPEIFKAADILRADGIKTVIEVRGLFDILNSLTDIQKVMMLWMKEPDVMQQICDRIREGLLEYVKAARDHCDLLFYSDASGGINVIGPRMGKKLVEWFTYPLMKDLQELLKDGPKLQMCPKTSFMLTGCGKAHFADIPAPPAETYAESCMALPAEVQFFGQRCSRELSKPGSGTISYLKLD